MTTTTTTATYVRPRRIEDGHDRRCLAAAMIAAVENARDDEGILAHEFRNLLVTGDVLGWAEGYLTDGTMTCTCAPIVAPLPYAVGDTVRRACEFDGEVGTVLAFVRLAAPDANPDVVVDLPGRTVLGTIPAFIPVDCIYCGERAHYRDGAWVIVNNGVEYVMCEDSHEGHVPTVA